MFEAIFAIYSLLPVRLKGKVRNILSKRCAHSAEDEDVGATKARHDTIAWVLSQISISGVNRNN
jgi:hypothetical protein